ncbi:peroxiredoxin [Macrococcus brunensis]|uniref:thioredoxin-dependent peroxiredoxin n=2 Tax=Macrococcus brunensis TaxID=198483 RepID=A0A4R6BEX5_9STAP|nr:peroxiredoxin [Macrococcus brunensis]ULG73110.1 peroxiredoxin [Macrococcus brunensis]ULG75290.1 peroxiredoxin [Macrococcus brunensis]
MVNQNGDMITEQDLKDKRTILYFYPRDNTPTCTTQAIDFTEHLAELQGKGIQVFGVNGDTMKKHQNFIMKHNIGFDLLVDEDYQLAKELDIYRLKKVFGKESMGIVRTTLLIGPDLTIEKRIDNVKVKNQLEVLFAE